MLWDELSKCIFKGKEEYQQAVQNPIHENFQGIQEIYPGPALEDWKNRFFLGDNKKAMLELLQGNNALGIPSMAGKINLIYIDPPYDSQRLYHYQVNLGHEMLHQVAYSDQWKRAAFDYLQMLAVRLYLMRDLLAEDGSILLHIDYHISHYVKILMDDIFGRNRFINEIVWCYGGGGAPKKHYTRKHDVILWYAKGKDWFFQPQYRPYSEGTLQRGLTAVKGSRYELHREGAALDDWWAEPEVQKFLSPTAKENVKYETQKPEGLIRRIIQGHSKKGDIVADFFCGSGTTGVVAEKMGRKWILADQGSPAFRVTRRRLLELPRFYSWEINRFYVPDFENPAGNHMKMDIQIQETLGGKVLQVSLLGYQVAGSLLQKMSAKQKALIEKSQQEDWLNLIEYWDIRSFPENGKQFKIEVSSMRSYEGKKIGVKNVSWQLSFPWHKDRNKLAVYFVDVLGNEQLVPEEKFFPIHNTDNI